MFILIFFFMITHSLTHSSQWLIHHDVSSLTVENQTVPPNFYPEKALVDTFEIRGTISLRAFYPSDHSFESALSGLDYNWQDQEDFWRIVLLDRIQVRAHVLDNHLGKTRPVGKVILLASNASEFEIRFRLTHLPGNEPIVVEVDTPNLLTSNVDPLRSRRYFAAVGWTGIALLRPEKPRLEEANFTLRLGSTWYE
jgi:hypothetical protein